MSSKGLQFQSRSKKISSKKKNSQKKSQNQKNTKRETIQQDKKEIFGCSFDCNSFQSRDQQSCPIPKCLDKPSTPPLLCECKPAFVIYRPGRCSSFPYVATWREVIFTVECAKGAISVLFDDTYESPIQLTTSALGICSSQPALDGKERTIFGPAQGRVPVNNNNNNSNSNNSNNQNFQNRWKKKDTISAQSLVPATSFASAGPRFAPFSLPTSFVSPFSLFYRWSFFLSSFWTKTQKIKEEIKNEKQEIKNKETDSKVSLRTKEVASMRSPPPSYSYSASSSFSSPNQVAVKIYIGKGVQFLDIAAVTGPLEIVVSPAVAYTFRFTATNPLFKINTGVNISNSLRARTAAIGVTANQNMVILVNVGINFDNTFAPSVPILFLESNASLLLIETTLCSHTTNTINGLANSSVSYVHDASCQAIANPLYPGNFGEGLMFQASEISYNDQNVPPPLIPNPSGFTGPTVQEAIDALKTQIQTSGVWNPNPFLPAQTLATVASDSGIVITNGNIVTVAANFTFSWTTPSITTPTISFYLPSNGLGTALNQGVSQTTAILTSTSTGLVGETVLLVGQYLGTITFVGTFNNPDTLRIKVNIVYFV